MLEAALRYYRPDQVQGQNLKILQPGDEAMTDLLDDFGRLRRKALRDAQVACFYERKRSNVGAIFREEEAMVRLPSHVMTTETDHALESHRE